MDNMTLKKLARELGLSVSTVSKAFQDSYEISVKTKQRVLDLAKRMNYQPNPYASGLRKQRSNTIAVVIPEIANNFFALAINGIESVARAKGYHVLIYLTHEDHNKEVEFIRHLQSGRVDGLLLSLSDGTEEHEHLSELETKSFPIVYFDRINPDSQSPRVTTDDYDSGYKATKHLIDNGCTSIGHLLYSRNLSIGNKRMEGYMQALRDHGLAVNKNLIVHCSNDMEQNRMLIRKMLKNGKPHGIFSSFEKLAILCYGICGEMKIILPEALKIVSFSNLETAAFMNPSLTTITQPAFDIGQRAASLLFERLEKGVGKPDGMHLIIPSTLVVRNSSVNRRTKRKKNAKPSGLQ